MIIAPGTGGKASVSLYRDDGVSRVQKAELVFQFACKGSTLRMTGTFNYHDMLVRISHAKLVGVTAAKNAKSRGYNATAQTSTININKV